MTISFDRVAEIYDESRNIPPHAKRRIVQILVTELKGHKTILDAGVGTGRYAKPLQDNGFHVVGLDIAPKMLRKAAEKGTSSLLRGDILNLPFKDSTFNATLTTSLLHLVKQWKKALQEITRVTKDLLISTAHKSPNPLSKAYTETLKKSGYPPQKRGISAWELKSIVKPTKSIPGPTYKIPIKERLKHLNQKAYSHQWNIPDNLHNQVMNELKDRFTVGTFLRETEVLIWDTNKLKAVLQQ